MRRENVTTFGQPVARDNEYQYATGSEPAIRVAQEHLFGATIVTWPQCVIIGWIQIEEAKALDGALHFQGISLNDIGNPLPGLLGAVGIKLNTVAKHLSAAGDNLERHAIANAGVDCGRWSTWKLKEPVNSLGFGQWQGVETETTFALKAHFLLSKLRLGISVTSLIK
jgi:hypothetical protein